MKKSYQPKPTRYRKIKFRSRLEARWAVFLDHYFRIEEWIYEPCEITVSTPAAITNKYTPDFHIRIEGVNYYLEVKPSYPSLEYVSDLKEIAKLTRTPVVLGYGSFWKNDCPIAETHEVKGHTTHPTILIANHLFYNSIKAYDIAKDFRLDLNCDNYQPPTGLR